jgi:nucleoside recognition membrane protein YjiH
MMKDSNTKKKLRAVLMAAILGVVLFDAMILINNQAYIMWRHGQLSDYWKDRFTGVAILLCMPPLLVGHAIGSLGGLVNEYTVDGLFGAVIFAMAAVFWQFVVKVDRETKR